MRSGIIVLVGPWIPCLLLVACGPQIELETATSVAEGSSDVDGMPSRPGTTTTSSPTPPGPTTDGPLDTGVLDTGPMPLDIPEHCSLLEQDCPPGYKCMPYANDGGNSWNDVMCVPVAEDPNAPGEPCTVEGNGTSGIDDCDVTSMCWDVDPDTNTGICVPHCIGDENNPTCANRCEFCTISGDGVLALCLSTCDPLQQDCSAGQACYPLNGRFACVVDASLPMAGIGSECEFLNACPPGLVCMNADGVPDCVSGTGGCCTPVCPVDGPDPCPGLLPGSVCAPYYEGDPPDDACLSTDPGVCLVP